MTAIRRRIFASAFAVALGFAAVPAAFQVTIAQASEIKYIVNNVPVTSYDIKRREAFLRLQRRKGGAKIATDEMIDQALRLAELKRLHLSVSDQEVDDAYQRFAASNKLKPSQMDQVLQQAGVTGAHFRDYIRAQMGWSKVLQLKFRQDAQLSEQDVVQRMLQKGGAKPSATEYMLQQVIFVVPKAERSSTLAKRKREADAMRGRFSGCDSTREFAKGLIDVTVRDLGRVLAPELPTEWADAVKSTKAGQATAVRTTDRGVEFIGVCSAKEVSDDRVAQLVFQKEAAGEGGAAEELSKKYMAELRERAKIVKR
jgi:peptidyl-prolyl cis-trans isomerase SurA